jgi:hypothetical protein
VIEVAQGGAAAGTHHARVRIDPHRAHAGQIDHQAIVAQGIAGDVVAAAAHRQRQAVVAREGDRGQHVGGAAAAGDEGRTPLDHRVPEGARALVVGIARLQQRPPECGLEVLDHVAFHVRHRGLRVHQTCAVMSA